MAHGFNRSICTKGKTRRHGLKPKSKLWGRSTIRNNLPYMFSILLANKPKKKKQEVDTSTFFNMGIWFQTQI
jgi:hypothetical protein